MWSLSSIPTEAAWAVLKRDGGLDSLPPELQEAMQSFYEQVPDEQREKIEAIAQAVEQMEPEKKHQIQQMMMQTLKHNGDKLPEILNQADPENLFAPQQSENGTFKLSMRGLGHEVAHAGQPINKLVPLLIWGAAAIFAADGVNQSQGAEASIVGNGLLHTGAALGIGGNAVFQDPLIGYELGRVENPSWWQSAAAGGLGALQGLGLGAIMKPIRGARGMASKVQAGRASRLKGKVNQPWDINKPGYAKLKYKQKQHDLQTNKLGRLEDSAARHAKGAKAETSLTGGAMRRGLQASLGDPRAKKLIDTTVAGLLTPSGNSPNIHGTASASPSAGGGGTGMTGVGNRASMGQGDKQIWSGAMEQQQGGAYGTKKGEYMTIGDEILKETKDRMQYAVCPACGKANCNCKEYKNKADDKKKKPAHGVLVIIGTNAGPGPIKEGKRVKKD